MVPAQKKQTKISEATNINIFIRRMKVFLVSTERIYFHYLRVEVLY